MKYLVLFDRKFPYKTGEAFLENEIEEIAKSFDKIIIYPTDVCEKEPVTRIIKAQNVDVRVLEKKPLSVRRFTYLWKGKKYALKSIQKGVIRKIYDGYYQEAAEMQAKQIIADLQSVGITKNDTIYLYSYWLYITATAACKVKEYFKKNQMKVIVFSRAHRFDIYEEKRKLGFLPRRKELFHDIDKIFACSDNGKEYLVKKYPEYKKLFATSHLGTYDHGMGRPSDRKTLKIVSCSRLSEVKRVDLIIDALEMLQKEDIQIEWTHLGGGKLINKLRKKADHQLKWMKYHMDGAISNKSVYEYYLSHEVDLFINVSASEGLPVSIMEAISFGIPVIATNVGGTGEIVINNVSGCLIEENFTVRELAQKIIYYAKMEDNAYTNLRKSTRDYWLKNYQAPVNYADFIGKILQIQM